MRRWLFTVYRPALSEEWTLETVEAEDSYHAIDKITKLPHVVGWDPVQYPDGTYSQPVEAAA